jgi:hypothetical protein
MYLNINQELKVALKLKIINTVALRNVLTRAFWVSFDRDFMRFRFDYVLQQYLKRVKRGLLAAEESSWYIWIIL